MSSAAKCDHCDALFERGSDTVRIEGYSLGRDSYSADSDGSWFDLCPACSREFLAFMRHEEPES